MIIGILQMAQTVQMFILGPRLILGVRETAMTTIAFLERIIQESSDDDV